MVDINRGTSGVNLPPEVSQEIWANTIEESAVMRVARQIRLPGSGVSVPIITGEATADWVGETELKPVSRATLANKTITPYKLAVIEPFSNEFRRDLPGLYAELARRLPSALGSKFDATVFGSTAPGSNFDTLGGATAVGIAGKTYKGLVAADQAIATGGGVLNGWALSPQARGLLLGAEDTTGRPIFINNVQADGAVPALLGAPVYMTRSVYASGSPNQLGFAGDWGSAVYGTVEGIQVSISDQATLVDGTVEVATGVDIPNLIHLYQQNMFAIRAEVEIGFRIKDLAQFVKLTSTVQS